MIAAERADIKPGNAMPMSAIPVGTIIHNVEMKPGAGGKIARAAGIPLAVDNTFATPVLQRPLDLGATLVVHSTTKYLNGHSDAVGGAVMTRDDVGGCGHR